MSHSSTQFKAGIGAILAAIFLAIAPLPFLSFTTEGNTSFHDIPSAVLRLGQTFAQPRLVERGEESVAKGTKTVQVDGVPFVVEIPPGVVWDEFEAIVDGVATSTVKAKYVGAKRLTFVEWNPAWLPMRVQYRYVLLFSLMMSVVGVYLVLTRPAKKCWVGND